jgi:mRNA interferase RelE/StbE
MIVIYHKPAAKALERMNKTERGRIKHAIGKIPDGNIRPLRGKYPLLRLRVGDRRILFAYKDDETVVIIEIGPRGDIYKGV